MSIETFFITTISLFVIGAIGSLFLRKKDQMANRWLSFFSVIGSIAGISLGIKQLLVMGTSSFSYSPAGLPLYSLSVNIDPLAAFFILLISSIALLCSIYGSSYIKHYYGKYSIGLLGFFYQLFIAGMLLVVAANNGIFFLLAWEIMSIASFFLVIYDYQEKENIKAGLLYLIMTHVGTVFIFIALILLYRYTGSFDFSVMRANNGFLPLQIKNIIFILALIGFGTKAGIIPLHIWLPSAHPAAPSHISALMSGVMIKTGIFMMIRIFLGVLSPIPTWWGLLVLSIGAISSLLGVLYALTEHDLKRLLAYHSIENIGIILLGLGSALTFYSINSPALALASLAAALFHTMNHAIFKSLLFLSAGAVINETHTRNMEEYGGLIKFMPQTALFFLIGSMAISALPPFNGFFSEWLTYQALFQGIVLLNPAAKLIFLFSIGSLAFTGGLALACFVKAFGVVFLARPRSEEVSHAKEAAFPLRFAMGALASLALLLGIFSAYINYFLSTVGSHLKVFQDLGLAENVLSNRGLTMQNSFGSVSGPVFFALLMLVSFLVIYVSKKLINPKQRIITGNTWDCGCDLGPRMEITATGFSRSIIVIFKNILKPRMWDEIEYHAPEHHFTAKTKTVNLEIKDIYAAYFYRPLQQIIAKTSSYMTKIQSGNVNAYVAYIFLALVITLFLAL